MLRGNEFHIIISKDKGIIFDIVGINLYIVSRTGGEIILDYFKNKKDIKKISQKYKIRKEKLEEYIKNFEKLIEQNRNNLKYSGLSPNVVSRLNINVSHKCNFACKYCYADHGSYGGNSSIMSPETAVQTVNFFCNEFDYIDSVVFFGGEPLLNVSAIDYVLKRFKEICRTKGVKLPKFAVLTNGSIYTEKIAKLLDKYNVAISVSIDGPIQIHDQIRVNKKGQGTFNHILSNIKRYMNFPNIELWYEATYTPLHKKEKVSRAQVQSFIENTVGIKKGTITDAFLPLQHSKDMENYCYTLEEIFEDYNDIENFVETSLNNIMNGKSFNWDIGKMINYFIERQPSFHFCTAGFQTFTVTPNGDIYPCQFFINETYKLGDVYKGFYISKLNEFRNFIDKTSYSKCKDCWLRYVCETCIGQYYQMTGKLSIPDVFCKFKKKLWETLLIKLSEIFIDKNKREKFIKNFNILSKGGVAK